MQRYIHVCKGKNSTGRKLHPPLEAIEPLMVEFCIALARLGEPLTKAAVITLANDLIADNNNVRIKVEEHHRISKAAIINFKVGKKWYRNFMKRHKDQISARAVNVKDKNRCTWVKEENFKAMYDCAYEAMVESRIARKDGDNYILTRPEHLVFVDETGCNTNQLKDGHVGGELFVAPNNEPEARI